MTLLDGAGSDADLEGHALRGGLRGVDADVAALPPLPEQDLCQMRAEASCGNSLVLFLIFLFVAPMQAYANAQGGNLTTMQRVWIFAIYAEAATAIFCLLGLMWDDPGTIKRTPENCFPLPDIVAEKLATGQSLESVGNVTGDDGRIFCIRCLVWRPDDGNTHHCSTCQRCVVEFDHHCGVHAASRAAPPAPAHAGPRLPRARCSPVLALLSHTLTPARPWRAAQVFGRCIAGDGCGGNMGCGRHPSERGQRTLPRPSTHNDHGVTPHDPLRDGHQ